MALQADGVHIRFSQELWVLVAVGRMAGHAACLLHGAVLIYPRPGQLRVAFETGSNLLVDGGLQLRFEVCVRIVAGGALHRTVPGFMVHRLGELGFNTGVAFIAERRLRGLQQLRIFAGVYRVATDAAHAGSSVNRSRKVWMPGSVTCEAARIGLRSGKSGGVLDSGGIAVAADVCFSGAVAALACCNTA